MELTQLTRYFPTLDTLQRQRFEQLPALYAEWNSCINVISRKDTEALEEHHILHSLAIAKFCTFAPGASIIDIGTGGGFPGIPLAILFPHCRFTLVDSIAKKIKVVQAVAEALGLQNVTPVCSRAEQLKGPFDVMVCRAVAGLSVLVEWTWPLLTPMKLPQPPHGIICLKGGDVTAEIAAITRTLPHPPVVAEVKEWFDNEFFETKKIIYIAV
jgi:16S rRNA (guanine527-N7)-methyltransferase